MMMDVLAADRYAQALFEIVRFTHQDEVIEEELGSFSAALKRSPEIEKFLQSPQLGVDEKRAMLLKIYQERRHEVYGVLLNFFTLLLEKGRFHLIHEITVSFKRIADEAQGQGTAELHSASPLKTEAERHIVERLERIAGYKIRVKRIVDPSLIGGVVVKVRNKVIDGSVKNKIQQIRKELTKIQSI